jgi:hypothetical protein
MTKKFTNHGIPNEIEDQVKSVAKVLAFIKRRETNLEAVFQVAEEVGYLIAQESFVEARKFFEKLAYMEPECDFFDLQRKKYQDYETGRWFRSDYCGLYEAVDLFKCHLLASTSDSLEEALSAKALNRAYLKLAVKEPFSILKQLDMFCFQVQGKNADAISSNLCLSKERKEELLQFGLGLQIKHAEIFMRGWTREGRRGNMPEIRKQADYLRKSASVHAQKGSQMKLALLDAWGNFILSWKTHKPEDIKPYLDSVQRNFKDAEVNDKAKELQEILSGPQQPKLKVQVPAGQQITHIPKNDA